MQRPKYVPAPGKGYEVVEPDWLARFPQRPDVAPCADFLRDAFCPCASYFSLQFALAVFRAAMPGICHGLLGLRLRKPALAGLYREQLLHTEPSRKITVLNSSQRL